MHDEFESGVWAQHHTRFYHLVRSAVRHMLVGLARLNARQFEAPWRAGRTRRTAVRP